MNGSEVLPNLRAHYTAFFEGHALTEHRRRVGPIASIVPEFTVVRVAPGLKTRFWTYLSLGASLAPHGDARLEFLFLAPFPSDRMVDLLAWSVHYHYGHQLGLGHTMPIGEPPEYLGVPDNLKENRFPTRWELDRVSPRNPAS